ncbi:MAG TPA: Arm DNA-binding domain-containing protein, partial [Candidatus Ratteibacteria bacterium]|nr:Arm DNA-binding domain-containing protein [Candidatus Ratteibacteria bacterium]HRR96037.1 Arm DNA-binding domain-containing protein [Candidatus Ratteibacteria bacterium]
MLKHTKMSVKLRENIKSSGAKSLYLDIVINGKRHKEYLGIVLKPAKTTEEKERNRELKRLAETIRAKREIELHENNYDLKPSYKRNVDFI